jgi:chromosome segregation ATPase
MSNDLAKIIALEKLFANLVEDKNNLSSKMLSWKIRVKEEEEYKDVYFKETIELSEALDELRKEFNHKKEEYENSDYTKDNLEQKIEDLEVRIQELMQNNSKVEKDALILNSFVNANVKLSQEKDALKAEIRKLQKEIGDLHYKK